MTKCMCPSAEKGSLSSPPRWPGERRMTGSGAVLVHTSTSATAALLSVTGVTLLTTANVEGCLSSALGGQPCSP